MSGMQPILQKFREKYARAAFFPGAKISEIDFISAMLKNDGFAPLPSGYSDFLQATNGMAAGAAELYGTEVHARPQNYKFPNLIEANKPFSENKNPLMRGRVLLGSAGLDIIIFDAEDGTYKIASRLSFDTLGSFGTLEALLTRLLETL
ncbi:MAG: YrhA family protein [Rickettsiales bacterium]|jgi:hypothetical protein|nr:YrhA family protein [Rickettsiales bacterium]